MSLDLVNANDILAVTGITLPGSTAPTAGAISFWSKCNWAQDDNADHVFFDATFGSGSALRFQKYSDDKLYFGSNSPGGDDRVVVAKDAFTLTQGVWNFWVGDFTNNGATNLYLNNVLLGTVASTTLFGTSGIPMSIGNYQGGSPAVSFNGKIFDFRDWGRVLSSQDHADLMAGKNIAATGQLNRFQLGNNLTDSWGSATAVASGTSFPGGVVTFDTDKPSVFSTSNAAAEALAAGII